MPTFRFHIAKDKPDKKGQCIVYLVYENGGQARISTKIKIKPSDFQPDTVKSWVKFSHGSSAASLNQMLLKMKGDAEDTMAAYYSEHSAYPSCDAFKRIYAVKTGAKSEFFDLFDRFVTYQATKSDPVSVGTVINYGKVKAKLEKYEKNRKTQLSFSAINVEFAADFPMYLRKEHGNSGTTVGDNIKILKAFLNWCELHHNIMVNKLALSEMKVRKEEKFFVWLSANEIKHLLSLDLSMKPIYETTRDAFCLQALLGFRHNELADMLLTNVVERDGKKFVQVYAKKNEKLMFFPVPDLALGILDKYKDINPKLWVPTLVYCNFYIKEVCKLAGFTEEVHVIKDAGIHRKEAVYRKYELVTTHSARRSFINNMKALGIDDAVIAAITRQDIRTLQTYKHADTAQMETAIDKLNNAFGGAPRNAEPKERPQS